MAVYAVLRSDRGLLLTQMSDRTNARGAWGLAGGGLDAGEDPEAALHREVWEESGQRVDRLEPWRVTTSHWVGRAPSGRLEDFHAVRVVYAAWCAEPTDPVVHDVGGTTQALGVVRRARAGGPAARHELVQPAGRPSRPHPAERSTGRVPRPGSAAAGEDADHAHRGAGEAADDEHARARGR